MSWGFAHAQENADAPAVPVTVAVAQERDLSLGDTFTGRVEAEDTVALQARVQGYLAERHFEEGQMVAEGDLLFSLDEDLYSNAVAQAQAALQVAQAQEHLAQQTFDRQEELTKKNVQSQAALDEASANLAVAKAQVGVAQSQLDQAKLNLGFTKISAPIAGRIGRAAVSKGALISPQSGALATIVQVDPMYVSFPVPQATLLAVRERGLNQGDAVVEIVLADGSTYPEKGRIVFADIQATASTDSVVLRAEVTNGEQILIDRQLVEVNISSDAENLQLVVPQQALLLDQQGAYVMGVDGDDVVQQVRIEAGRQQDGYIEVLSGLSEGDRVIITGIQKVRPGIKVAPSTATVTQ